jgi:hypothetical protein
MELIKDLRVMFNITGLYKTGVWEVQVRWQGKQMLACSESRLKKGALIVTIPH